jgi:hypothetical protein
VTASSVGYPYCQIDTGYLSLVTGSSLMRSIVIITQSQFFRIIWMSSITEHIEEENKLIASFEQEL